MTTTTTVPAPQRWLRPFVTTPGHMKALLPTRVLAVGARGELAALRALLTAHPEYLNKRGAMQRTLLWEAARRGRLAAVKLLADRGADLEAAGCYNHESVLPLTPYAAAVYYRRAAVADYLRGRGAGLDVFRAAFLGEQAALARALEAEPALLNAEDPHDSTYYSPVLAFAVAGGQAALAEWLLARGAAVAPYSAMLLQLAARLGREDLLALLLAHGAEARAADPGIVLAAPSVDMARRLLERGVPLTRSPLNGFPPLVYAARGDKAERPELVALLLEWGAPVNEAGPRGRTALHYAAAGGQVQVLRVLLAHGADRTRRDEAGATPLALARAAGQRAAVALLSETA